MIIDLVGQAAGSMNLFGLSGWSAHLTTSVIHDLSQSAPVQAAPNDGLIDWTSRKLREFRILILLAVWVFVAGMVGFVYARTKGSWGATLAAIILGAIVLAGVHNMDALQGNVGAEINSAPSPAGLTVR